MSPDCLACCTLSTSTEAVYCNSCYRPRGQAPDRTVTEVLPLRNHSTPLTSIANPPALLVGGRDNVLVLRRVVVLALAPGQPAAQASSTHDHIPKRGQSF